jgi:hypothetical protein
LNIYVYIRARRLSWKPDAAILNFAVIAYSHCLLEFRLPTLHKVNLQHEVLRNELQDDRGEAINLR